VVSVPADTTASLQAFERRRVRLRDARVGTIPNGGVSDDPRGVPLLGSFMRVHPRERSKGWVEG
jgi:hypothetical protein